MTDPDTARFLVLTCIAGVPLILAAAAWLAVRLRRQVPRVATIVQIRGRRLVVGYDAPSRPAEAPPIAPARWRGHQRRVKP